MTKNVNTTLITIFAQNNKKCEIRPDLMAGFCEWLRKNVYDRCVFLPENQQKTPMLYPRRFDPKKNQNYCGLFLGRGGDLTKMVGHFDKYSYFFQKVISS